MHIVLYVWGDGARGGLVGGGERVALVLSSSSDRLEHSRIHRTSASLTPVLFLYYNL